jgi:ribose transport system substrate-binding protein
VTISTDTAREGTATATTSEPRPQRQRAFSPISLIIIAALVVTVLWYAGVFRGAPRVALITSGEGPYWDLVIAGAEDAAEQADVKLSVTRSKSDLGVQSQHIQAALADKPAGVAISPLDPNAQGAILADVAANSTLVTIDSDSPVSRRLCFVGTDNYAAGRLCGQAVKRAVPDGGEVVICMGFPNKDNTLRRRQGVIDELLDRPDDPQHRWDALDQPLKGDRYTIAATLTDEGDRDKAKRLADEAVRTRTGVACFVGLVSYSAPTVAQALKDAGRAGQAKVVSFDVDERTLAGVADGAIDATVMQDQYGLGYHAVRILAAEAKGNRGELPAFQMHVLPSRLVTKENLEQVRLDLANRRPIAPSSKSLPPPTQRPPEPDTDEPPAPSTNPSDDTPAKPD